MQFITLLILLIYSFYNSKKNNILRPDFIYTVSMLGTLYITGMRIASYQSEYEWWFYFLIYFSVALFYVGYIFIKQNCAPQKNINMLGYKYNSETMKLVIVILFILVLASFISIWAIKGAPPFISKSSDRSEYYLSGWGAFYSLNTVLYALMLFDHFQKKCLSNKVYEILSSIIFIIVVLMGNKFQIFTLLIVYYSFISVFKRGQSLISVIKFVAFAVALFYFMYAFVYEEMYNFTIEDTIYWYGLKLSKDLGFLAHPYLYIVNNFDNLYNYIQTDNSISYGYNTAFNMIRSHEICTMLFDDRIARNSSLFFDSLKMSSLNTGSCLSIPYSDFGMIGIIFYSIFLGMMAGLAERLLKVKKSFFSVFMYVYINICVSFSFFTESFFAKPLLINFFFALFISKAICFNIFKK